MTLSIQKFHGIEKKWDLQLSLEKRSLYLTLNLCNFSTLHLVSMCQRKTKTWPQVVLNIFLFRHSPQLSVNALRLFALQGFKETDKIGIFFLFVFYNFWQTISFFHCLEELPEWRSDSHSVAVNPSMTAKL